MAKAKRNAKGQFATKVSGNPLGRPKGSKNKVTLLKLMVEEAIREENVDDMLKVAKLIIGQAIDGDGRSQKLVWDAVMSKGTTDDRTQAKEKVEINIGGIIPEKPIEVTAITIEETIDEQADE